MFSRVAGFQVFEFHPFHGLELVGLSAQSLGVGALACLMTTFDQQGLPGLVKENKL